MGKTVCKAKKSGMVPSRGRPSIEWHKDGVPPYYCYGYIDRMTDQLLEICKDCRDNVIYSQDDLKKYKE